MRVGSLSPKTLSLTLNYQLLLILVSLWVFVSPLVLNIPFIFMASFILFPWVLVLFSSILSCWLHAYGRWVSITRVTIKILLPLSHILSRGTYLGRGLLQQQLLKKTNKWDAVAALYGKNSIWTLFLKEEANRFCSIALLPLPMMSLIKLVIVLWTPMLCPRMMLFSMFCMKLLVMCQSILAKPDKDFFDDAIIIWVLVV